MDSFVPNHIIAECVRVGLDDHGILEIHQSGIEFCPTDLTAIPLLSESDQIGSPCVHRVLQMVVLQPRLTHILICNFDHLL